MSENNPYNFGGPASVAAVVGGGAKIINDTIDSVKKYRKDKQKMVEKVSKIQETVGRNESFAKGKGGSGKKNIKALGEVLGTLMDKSAGHDLSHMQETNRQGRLNAAHNVRSINRVAFKGGTRFEGAIGEGGAINMAGTRAIDAPAAKKPAAKKAPVKKAAVSTKTKVMPVVPAAKTEPIKTVGKKK